jgi:hypothetical protein
MIRNENNDLAGEAEIISYIFKMITGFLKRLAADSLPFCAARFVLFPGLRCLVGRYFIDAQGRSSYASTMLHRTVTPEF